MEVLGIDVGGSGIKGAIVDIETGELVTKRYRIATPKGGKPEDVADTIAKIVEHFNWKGKIGCGFPAVVFHGKVMTANNIDESWIGVQANELFKKKTGLDFVVANDADAAGEAIMKFGTGKDEKGLVIVITVGTGLGSAMFYRGKLIPNTELGVVPYKKYKRFEQYAADSARTREKLSFKRWGARLNKFLKFVNKVFSPDMIILGGGISKEAKKFQKYLTTDVPIVPAKLQNEAGIIGAALLVVEDL
ncbi:polyphosphate--glucose phosphotransferase [Urechidicola croceus]|uniref:Polyphosphate glucokinase n=1 Tax=Urechidicola croceus TaxID=1850246 RepID=A0A1D8P4Q5_9FLAO|nr:ROK family protein [Urechidicola croceus]AOW19544.1 polyphosphate glucokinase [Urechidicola croceus]